MSAVNFGSDVTHLFFGAYQIDDTNRSNESRVNAAMLENTVRSLLDGAAPLQHMILIHGGKAYGAHFGHFKTPAVETDAPVLGPLFYHPQLELARSWAEEHGIGFTVLRPNHICGIGFGPFVNIIHIIAMYGSITKYMGQPLRFPGTEAGYHSLSELTHAGLLARGSIWAATSPKARNEIFNISNGDFVRWVNMWPRIAEFFDVEIGQPLPYNLLEVMADVAPLWPNLVRVHALQPIPFENMVSSWNNVGILTGETDIMSSTIKIRQAGFSECMDSEVCVLSLLQEMRDTKLIP
jgi:nucleoside-diphosphate-sugar epimerase